MDTFVQWADLLDWGVLVMAVLVVTQFTKALVDRLFEKWKGLHVPTQALAWAWAVILILLSLGSQGELTLWGIPLALLNGVFVALAAMKLWEKINKDPASLDTAAATASAPAPGA